MFSLPSPLQKLDLSVFGVDQKVYVKRDDLIHTIISGNKWRKLKQNLDYFFKSSKKGIVSLGGAYSSHVLALSYLCKQNDIPLVLLIRGQKPKQFSNILEQCVEHKSKLIFLDRTDYSDSSYVSNLVVKNWTNYFFIPEGGANKWGILGCQEIINELGVKFNEIYCEVGSGATLSGLSAACSEQQIVKGIVVLKGAHDIDMDIKKNYQNLFDRKLKKNVQFLHDYHFGGYAKYNQELVDFIREFFKLTGIKTDPIYSGKLFYGLIDQLANKSEKNKTVIALHSGGLSGVPGFEKRYGIKLFN